MPLWATSTSFMSPFHEGYRPRPSTRSGLTSSPRFSSSLLSSSYPPTTPTLPFSAGNPLLWSSHWFFLNRKQKRILYVSVWARKRSFGSRRIPVNKEYFVFGNEPTYRLHASAAGRNGRIHQFSESDESDGSPVYMKFPSVKERFLGWEGAAGAGARALGLDD